MKTWLKEFVVAGASRAGYELIPKWRFERQPLVRHLQHLFDLHRIDCVFDVGGNLGQYRDLLREDVGFEGRILSFEPVSKYAAMLKERARSDPLWHVYDYALGSTEGSAVIHVTQSPGLNSFLPPRSDAHTGFWKNEAAAQDETVRVRRLDDVIGPMRHEFSFRSPYLKLDTQGFDLEVVKGGDSALPSFRAMQTEASVVPIYAGMPTHLETLATLAGRNFQLSAMFPVTHDDDLRLIEYDCVLLNRAIAAR